MRSTNQIISSNFEKLLVKIKNQEFKKKIGSTLDQKKELRN